MPDVLTDSQRKLIAFEIAEAARSQVTSWASWSVGVFVIVGATLGLKTYLDIQGSIKGATDKQLELAHERSEKSIANFEKTVEGFEKEQKKELEAFRMRSKEAFEKLKEEADIAVESVRRTRQDAEALILGKSTHATRAESPRTVDRRSRQRPIGPGISISGKRGTAGTTCCVVRDKEGEKFILTASFCVNKGDQVSGSEDGDPVIQPGGSDGGTVEDVIGVVHKVTDIAALIRLNDGITASYDVPEIGHIKGIGDPSQISPGKTVRQYGRTTGLSTGAIEATSVTANVSLGNGGIQIRECFSVRSAVGDFSAGGDGGAPVVDEDGKLMGMIFAGGGGITFVIPIKQILEQLEVELVTE